MLYKPEGMPSFELLSYILSSDLNVISRVLNESAINPNQIFACGDLKQIFSTKLHKSVEIRRVSNDAKNDGNRRGGQYDYNNEQRGNLIFYEGNFNDRFVAVDPDGPNDGDINPLIAQ